MAEPLPPPLSRSHDASHPAELPELPDDVIGDILLRLQPEDPACLLRASLACKRWCRILADPAFRQSHRARHRIPSYLGFLHIVSKNIPYHSRFVPSDPASGRPAGRDLPGWLALDCRHGRALFATPSPSWGPQFLVPNDLIVWDPLTGVQRRLPRPSPPPTAIDFGDDYGTKVKFGAAVLCAAAAKGCDHSDCHGGPFSVIILFAADLHKTKTLSARVYSSETGKWSKRTRVYHPDLDFYDSSGPGALVRDALYFHVLNMYAVKYQLDTHCLSVININPSPTSVFRGLYIRFTSMEDGGLGFIGVEEGSARLCLYSREEGPDGVGQWALVRAIKLKRLLPDGALPDHSYEYGDCSDPDLTPSAEVIGSVDGTDVFFVRIQKSDSDPGAVYLVQLNPRRAMKVLDGCTSVFPYTSFCIPGHAVRRFKRWISDHFLKNSYGHWHVEIHHHNSGFLELTISWEAIEL